MPGQDRTHTTDAPPVRHATRPHPPGARPRGARPPGADRAGAAGGPSDSVGTHRQRTMAPAPGNDRGGEAVGALTLSTRITLVRIALIPFLVLFLDLGREREGMLV